MDLPLLSQFAQPATIGPINNTIPADNSVDMANNSAASDGQEGLTASTSNSQLSIVLTVRLLMQGKEVGSIIGKRGDHIKFIRDKSGAKINISDGSCAERIVTITGNSTTINSAFHMIAQKFEEDMQAFPNNSAIPKPPITLRLIIPATQCGSIIGKGGTKIKEIREKTGASIQVASEMLPNSTERAVTISGGCEALTDCMKQICIILQEAPPKGATLPFRPKPTYNPMIIANSVASIAAAQQQQNQLLQQIQAQHQSQHNTNMLMHNLQYAQSTPIYSLVQSSNTKKSPTTVYSQFPTVPTAGLCPDLQSALLGNIALQMTQQYPMSIEEMQSALLGSPSLAATMMPSWPTGIDPTSSDLLAQLPANFSSQPSTVGPVHSTSTKSLVDGFEIGQTNGSVHKVNGTSRSTPGSTTNAVGTRFKPY